MTDSNEDVISISDGSGRSEGAKKKRRRRLQPMVISVSSGGSRQPGGYDSDKPKEQLGFSKSFKACSEASMLKVTTWLHDYHDSFAKQLAIPIPENFFSKNKDSNVCIKQDYNKMPNNTFTTNSNTEMPELSFKDFSVQQQTPSAVYSISESKANIPKVTNQNDITEPYPDLLNKPKKILPSKPKITVLSQYKITAAKPKIALSSVPEIDYNLWTRSRVKVLGEPEIVPGSQLNGNLYTPPSTYAIHTEIDTAPPLEVNSLTLHNNNAEAESENIWTPQPQINLHDQLHVLAKPEANLVMQPELNQVSELKVNVLPTVIHSVQLRNDFLVQPEGDVHSELQPNVNLLTQSVADMTIKAGVDLLPIHEVNSVTQPKVCMSKKSKIHPVAQLKYSLTRSKSDIAEPEIDLASIPEVDTQPKFDISTESPDDMVIEPEIDSASLPEVNTQPKFDILTESLDNMVVEREIDLMPRSVVNMTTEPKLDVMAKHSTFQLTQLKHDVITEPEIDSASLPDIQPKFDIPTESLDNMVIEPEIDSASLPEVDTQPKFDIPMESLDNMVIEPEIDSASLPEVNTQPKFDVSTESLDNMVIEREIDLMPQSVVNMTTEPKVDVMAKHSTFQLSQLKHDVIIKPEIDSASLPDVDTQPKFDILTESLDDMVIEPEIVSASLPEVNAQPKFDILTESLDNMVIERETDLMPQSVVNLTTGPKVDVIAKHSTFQLEHDVITEPEIGSASQPEITQPKFDMLTKSITDKIVKPEIDSMHRHVENLANLTQVDVLAKPEMHSIFQLPQSKHDALTHPEIESVFQPKINMSMESVGNMVIKPGIDSLPQHSIFQLSQSKHDVITEPENDSVSQPKGNLFAQSNFDMTESEIDSVSPPTVGLSTHCKSDIIEPETDSEPQPKVHAQSILEPKFEVLSQSIADMVINTEIDSVPQPEVNLEPRSKVDILVKQEIHLTGNLLLQSKSNVVSEPGIDLMSLPEGNLLTESKSDIDSVPPSKNNASSKLEIRPVANSKDILWKPSQSDLISRPEIDPEFQPNGGVHSVCEPKVDAMSQPETVSVCQPEHNQSDFNTETEIDSASQPKFDVPAKCEFDSCKLENDLVAQTEFNEFALMLQSKNVPITIENVVSEPEFDVPTKLENSMSEPKFDVSTKFEFDSVPQPKFQVSTKLENVLVTQPSSEIDPLFQSNFYVSSKLEDSVSQPKLDVSIKPENSVPDATCNVSTLLENPLLQPKFDMSNKLEFDSVSQPKFNVSTKLENSAFDPKFDMSTKCEFDSVSHPQFDVSTKLEIAMPEPKFDVTPKEENSDLQSKLQDENDSVPNSEVNLLPHFKSDVGKLENDSNPKFELKSDAENVLMAPQMQEDSLCITELNFMINPECDFWVGDQFDVVSFYKSRKKQVKKENYSLDGDNKVNRPNIDRLAQVNLSIQPEANLASGPEVGLLDEVAVRSSECTSNQEMQKMEFTDYLQLMNNKTPSRCKVNLDQNRRSGRFKNSCTEIKHTLTEQLSATGSPQAKVENRKRKVGKSPKEFNGKTNRKDAKRISLRNSSDRPTLTNLSSANLQVPEMAFAYITRSKAQLSPRDLTLTDIQKSITNEDHKRKFDQKWETSDIIRTTRLRSSDPGTSSGSATKKHFKPKIETTKPQKTIKNTLKNKKDVKLQNHSKVKDHHTNTTKQQITPSALKVFEKKKYFSDPERLYGLRSSGKLKQLQLRSLLYNSIERKPLKKSVKIEGTVKSENTSFGTVLTQPVDENNYEFNIITLKQYEASYVLHGFAPEHWLSIIKKHTGDADSLPHLPAIDLMGFGLSDLHLSIENYRKSLSAVAIKEKYFIDMLSSAYESPEEDINQFLEKPVVKKLIYEEEDKKNLVTTAKQHLYTDESMPYLPCMKSSLNTSDNFVQDMPYHFSGFDDAHGSAYNPKPYINENSLIVDDSNPELITMSQIVYNKLIYQKIIFTYGFVAKSLSDCLFKHESVKKEFQMVQRCAQVSLSHSVEYFNQNGEIIAIYYLNCNLIVVQRSVISFWSLTYMDNEFDTPNMFLPRGSTRRQVLEAGICKQSADVVMSFVDSFAYFELWVKEHYSDQGEQPAVADIFVAIYFSLSSGECSKEVLHLQTINGFYEDIQFIVLRNSRNIIVSWNFMNNSSLSTFIRCYELSPNYQTLLSIREIESVNYCLSSLHIIEELDGIFMGCGNGKISFWNSENLNCCYHVSTIEVLTGTPSWQALWATFDEGFLFVLIEEDDGLVHLVSINPRKCSWRPLYTYDPTTYGISLKDICIKNKRVVACSGSGITCWEVSTGHNILQSFGENKIFLTYEAYAVIVYPNGEIQVQQVLDYLASIAKATYMN